MLNRAFGGMSSLSLKNHMFTYWLDAPLMTISYSIPSTHSIPYSIPTLEHKITNNEISITNVMNIFKGDNPAAQFESGQQKNDDHFCWQCWLLATLSPNIAHTMSLPNLPPEFAIHFTYHSPSRSCLPYLVVFILHGHSTSLSVSLFSQSHLWKLTAYECL